MVIEIKSLEEFTAQLEEGKDKLIIIDFFATWCGPCKIIAPKFEALSKEKVNVVFLKVDVDEHEDIASQYEINSMPTFVFIKNKTEVNRIIGANMENIKQTIESYE